MEHSSNLSNPKVEAKLRTQSNNCLLLHVISDLHIDQHEGWKKAFEIVQKNVDCQRGQVLDATLVVAGDIMPLKLYNEYVACLKYLKSLYKNVIIVMGNHEHYLSAYDITVHKFENACAETGVIGLNRNTYLVDGVLFTGCTLWSNPAPSLSGKYCIVLEQPKGTFK